MDKPVNDDAELLRRYLAGSEAAFTAFVERHLGLVYGTAWRRTGDPGRARDVAQIVFIDAARRAAALAERPSIAGWLYTAALHTAANLLRSEARRARREQIAQAMQLNDRPESPPAWEPVRAVLDAALGELSKADREAVLDRYFAGCSVAEIAARRRISENAARMRVERALERLRQRLERRGIVSTAAALGAVLTGPAVAAPAGLAGAVAAQALTAAAASGAGAGFMTFLLMQKPLKAAIALLLAFTVVPPLLEWRTSRALAAEVAALSHSTPPLSSESATDDSPSSATVADDGLALRELAQLEARKAVLKARPPGVTDAAMRPPVNAGTATPEAAFETANWALSEGDVELYSRLFVFDDETRANVQAFFDQLSEPARERFGTPQLLIASAWVHGTRPPNSAWMQSMQVLDSTVAAAGVQRVKLWQRTGAGLEFANVAEFEQHPQGWLMSAGATAKVVRHILTRLDPATGEIKPLPAPRK